MIITNKFGLPEAMVRAVETSPHNSEGSLSATTLLRGIKETVLTKRHWSSLEDDVSDRIWALFGTAVHSLLEHEGETEVCEEQLSFIVDDIKITGRLDNYCLQSGTVTDYKTASVWKVKFNDFSDWEKQGMIYAWLLKKAGFEPKKLRFVAMLKDHSKTEAGRTSSYPQSPIHIVEFEVNDAKHDWIEKFIIGKVAEYKQAQELGDDEIEPCTEEERWAKPTKWAVVKKGAKRATKLCDTEQEAIDYIGVQKDFEIEYRAGESTKCISYCSCNKYCNFYKELICKQQI